PMLWENRGIGSIMVMRQPPKPFSDKEIALLGTFADQAVIAIENARLFNETQQALERQTATADILKVIASSPSDVQPVFEAIAERSNRLIDGMTSAVYSIIDDAMHLMAFTRTSPEADAAMQASFPRPLSEAPWADQIRKGEIVEIPDAEIEWADHPVLREILRLRGFRSVLFVPLLHDGVTIGIISVTRLEAGRFAAHHVQLLQTFADQAVIAIENTRLFNEVQARTRDLGEALEQQTATSEVLAVISRSPSDLNPVLQAISDTAARLCGSEQTMFFRYDGNVFRILASWNFPPEVHEMLERRPLMPGHPSAIGRAGASLKPVCIPDVLADPAYGLTGEQSRARYRATLAVPLLREGRLVGALSLNRSEPGAFTEKQIELVATFADQAVIAIENTRLFNETREALAYQTGSSNVLRVIASSPADVEPVLKEIVESARELCEANDAVVLLKDEEHLRFSAHSGPIPVKIDKWPISRDWTAGRAFVDQKPVHVHDMLSGEGAEFPDARAMGQSTGSTIHTVLSVPLLRGNESIGAILLRRTEVRPFNDKQINLLSTFADQAVIAIENTRLFNETKEALERQTATAEILKVIASSPDDVQPVFQAIAERSNHLVGGFATTVVSIINDVVHLSAFTPTTPAADAALGAFYPRPLSGFTYSDAVRRGEIHRIVDAEVELAGQSDQLTIVRQRGWRSALWVPLLLDGEAIGVIGATRVEQGPFADHHVEMLKTFADQAVIAISNVNLFRQVQERTRELSQSLDELRSAQDRLVQTEKLASLGQLTAGIAHEIKNPLNFVNNFSALSVELIDEMTEIFENPALDEAGRRKELDEIRELLKSNLEKVVQHGKRADSIVKNMLLHSREGSGEQRAVDINVLLDESLNLAYHGARAEKPGFNITLQRDLDPDAGVIELFPQEITRALLNLISNGFYAASKREAENGEADFEPVLSAATKNLGNHIEIRIRDNGTGIPPEVKEKMFNPFFTTKPAGEGTGLGLSMSHDIIVKQHGGRIEVDTEPGQFTEFTIVLPRAANLASTGKS
ncbi:MAG: GAF domain-containing protein, partial [Bradyrhizobium sp.]